MIRALNYLKDIGAVIFAFWCGAANALFHLGTFGCVVVSLVLIWNYRTANLSDAKNLWLATIALLGAIFLKRHFGQGTVRLNAKQLGSWKNMEDK
jgi:hypothetical protein